MANTYNQQVVADGAAVFFQLHEPTGSSTVTDYGTNGVAGGVAGATLGVVDPVIGSPGTVVESTQVTGSGIGPFTAGLTPINFTEEIWVNPTGTDPNNGETNSGTAGVNNNPPYVVYPIHQGSNAGVGISVGTNAVTVYAHGNAFLAPLLRYATTISGWTHIVVTVTNNVPKLYINGTLVRTGFAPFSRNAYGSDFIGTGPYGPYKGRYALYALYPTVLSDTQIANHYTLGTTAPPVASGPGGGGGGSGVGNMFGGYFLGETLLGADPGADSGSGGTGTGVGNMLGGFFVGETMLGGDQAAGAGGSPPLVTSGAVYSMGGAVAGRTTVTATPRLAVSLRTTGLANLRTTVSASLTQSSLRAGYVTCGTTVTARLSTASYLSVQNITCRTTVSATMRKVIPALTANAITCSTSVTAALTRSTLRGQNIYSPMYVAGTLNLTPLRLQVEGIRGSTSITGRVGLARAYTTSSNITCSTTVHADLTYSSVLSGGSVVDYTTVSGSLTRSYLRGSIVCGTTVTGGTPTVQSRYFGTITGRTTVAVVEGGFRRTLRALLSTDVQTIACGTTVRGRTYVTPLDFVPIYLNTSTRIVANLGLQLRFGSAALSNFSHGKTTVTGFVRGLQTAAGTIHGKTTVTGKAKAGFGGEVLAYGYVVAALGIKYLLTNARVSKIQCKTTIVVGAPRNGTSGRAWGGTRFAYTYGLPDSQVPYGYDYSYSPPLAVFGHYIGSDRNYDDGGGPYYAHYYAPHFPTLGIYVAIKPRVIAGSTRLRSLVVPSRAWAHNQKGAPPFYGPYGSVSLYISPKGDVGPGDFIDGSTVVASNMLALRHRLLQLFGATGLQAPGQIIFTGDAARGLGTKLVTGGPAVKILAERAPVKQNAYYV